MKTIKAILLASLPLIGTPLHAAAFTSGSDGSYGPIDVAASATVSLQLPPDGIFNATTINVATGATVIFVRNSLNTPVYLLAQGDINIQGTIEISGGTSTTTLAGPGGPGGFDGGAPGLNGAAAGSGFGPGAGRGGTASNDDSGSGSAAYGSPADNPTSRDGTPYGGPLLVPLIGGSGGGGREPSRGGGSAGGGGGGGAILLASSTQISVNGAINAKGGINFSGSFGHGSGGAIRMVAPVVTGTGTLDVRGGSNGDNAGYGRIRIDSPNRSGLNLNYVPFVAMSAGTFMVTFPGPLPRLDIIRAAGQTIPEGTAGSVQVVLPTGSPAAQTIRVQARNFTGCVPITVVLTSEAPDTQANDRILYNAQIDMSTNPAVVDVPVTFQANIVTHIDVWTRQTPCQ